MGQNTCTRKKMQRICNDFNKKRDRTLVGSAQVYRGNDVSKVTETVHSANASCTSTHQNAGTGKERPEKPCRNRALEFPPDQLLELVKAHFKYSAARGKLFYRQGTLRGHAARTRKIGPGYVTTTWLGMEWRIHRLIWMLVNNAALQPGDEIDHINQIRDDNRPANLRKVTHAQNQWNAKTRKDNTSGLKGVTEYRGKRGVSYSANISINGKVKYLGAFPTALEASEAYQKKALELRSEYVPDYQRAAAKAFVRKRA